jgi:RimJ/RimL family protein N-acetyltransferase
MGENEFQAYLANAIHDYAEDKIKSGNWHPAEALQKSAAEYQALLPAGLASQNQYLFSIVAPENETTIGMIWFAVDDARPQPSAFIYDFIIFEEFRRRGYGTQALMAVEEKVGALGLDTISLHVFGHNNGARALYEKVGYEITNLNMSKKLNIVGDRR